MGETEDSFVAITTLHWEISIAIITNTVTLSDIMLIREFLEISFDDQTLKCLKSIPLNQDCFFHFFFLNSLNTNHCP